MLGPKGGAQDVRNKLTQIKAIYCFCCAPLAHRHTLAFIGVHLRTVCLYLYFSPAATTELTDDGDDSMPSNTTHHRYGFIALIASVSLLLLNGCTDQQQAPPAADARPPMTVSVKTLQPQTVPASLEVVAETEGAKQAEVRARVSGILQKQLYTEGEYVEAGQPLFQIERETYQIAVDDAQARADLAAREVKRLEKLLEQKAVSRREYDNAVSADAIARAALRQAKLNLSWTTVTAPLSGMSGRAEQSVGSLLSASDATLLTSIYQQDPIWVRFSLADSELAKLPGKHPGAASIQGIELILPDGSVYPEAGRINYLSSIIDPQLGTQQMRAEFDNKDARLLPGQFVRVRLLLQGREGVFLVPQSAVMQSEGGHLVMLANDQDQVTPRPVKVAEWLGTDWVITSGLNAGERVILDNLIKLRPQMKVSPKAASNETSDTADKK
jgi:membrane fusion protein (multidrug efflux system)